MGVEALDLDVFPGEVFGFLGPNGSGKTTTIRLLLDLILARSVPRSRHLAASGLLLLLAVGGYALLLATDARRRGNAVARTVALTLLLYWLDFMGDYWDALLTARRLSPFHYFDSARAVMGSGVGGVDVAVLGGIFLLASAEAFLNFRRQDLPCPRPRLRSW